MNERAELIYAPLRYRSGDIAITPDGLVPVELNDVGTSELPQNTTGCGLFTPEVRAFSESCGYQFGAEQKSRRKRLSLFGRRPKG